MSMSFNTKKDPCKANACRIQACLKENNYQEDKCLEVLEQMRQCCLKWHTKSWCCSGIDLNRPYLPESTTDDKSKANIMKSSSIPPYKPPPELQEALNQQAAKRKRTAQLPKRSWIQRNPRIFQVTFITASLRFHNNKKTRVMESVRKAKQRLRHYPILLGKCADSATVYAACVSRDLNVQHKTCDKEFKLFKECLQKASRDMNTKL